MKVRSMILIKGKQQVLCISQNSTVKLRLLKGPMKKSLLKESATMRIQATQARTNKYYYLDTVFRDFGDLEDGDEFHVKMENGTFVYEMQDHTIVDAEDRTVIDPEREDEFLTVSTCYPFS